MLRKTFIGLAASLALAAGTSSALAQGTAITYQGQLKNSGAAVNTATDMQFSLWTLASGGSQVGSTVTSLAVPVSQGLFAAPVDFGVNPYTSSQNLYLQIAVRNPAGSGSYVPMGTRQLLTPAPFSLATRGIDVSSDGKAGVAALRVGSNVMDDGTFARPLIVKRNPLQDIYLSFQDNDSPVNEWELRGDNFDASLSLWAGFDQRVTFQQNGNVGIGSLNPAEMLELGDTNLADDRYMQISTAGGNQFRAGIKLRHFADNNGFTLESDERGGSNGFHIIDDTDIGPTSVTRLFIENDSGRVGIGLTNPYNLLDVPVGATIGCSTQIGEFNDEANRGTKVSFGYNTPPDGCGSDNFRGMRVEVVPGTQFCGNSTDLTFWTDECNSSCPREVMRINGSGNVGIGLVPSGFSNFRLDVAGNIRCTTLSQTSSREFKQDITPLTGALESIMKLNGVTYAWNDQAPEQVRGSHDIGFIADEMNEVLPDIVAKDASGKPIGIDYGKVTPVAVEAIKQLKGENDLLKARLEKIEALLAAQPLPQAAAK